MAGNKESEIREPRKEECTVEQSPAPTPAVRQWLSVHWILALATTIVLVAIVWAEPRPVGDYYIALAAGRDIVNSRFACLTQPDTWSFMTDGRIWLNQNWGTHLLYYLIYELGGNQGVLLLKALVLSAMTFFLAMACRQRKVGWPVALLVSGAAVAAGRSFIDLRPNMVGLMIVPLMLWLLYSARAKPHRAWAALLVIGVWANSHGSFVFGLGMMGLWTSCWLITLALLNGIKVTLRRYWPMLVAAAAAVVVSGVLTPFGAANLTHPFVIARSHEWRAIKEWHPIYELGFGTIWEFYTVTGLLIALPLLCSLIYLKKRNNGLPQLKVKQLGPLIFSICLCVTLLVLAGGWQVDPGRQYESLRLDRLVVLMVTGGLGVVGTLTVTFVLVGLGRHKYSLVRPNAQELAMLIFELCLAAVVIAMAIKARRFIPLAIILVAPMVAVHVQWLLSACRCAWPVTAAAMALLIPALFAAQEIFQYYHPDNPMLPPYTMFQRMMSHRYYPPGAADFINANGLSGKVFNAWTWEGYLRWMCPQLKLFVGGRAQQVYDMKSYELMKLIEGGHHFTTLNKLEVHLAVVSNSRRYRLFIHGMTHGSHGQWTYIYYDGVNAVLADSAWSETRQLIDRAAAGQLEYPDPGIAALSMAKCLSSKVGGETGPKAVKALMKANALRPTPRGYMVLKTRLSRTGAPPRMLIPYWEEQSRHLEEIPVWKSGGFDILTCQHIAADTLSRLYDRVGKGEKANQWAAVAARIRKQAAEMEDKWQGRLSAIHYPHPFLPRKNVTRLRRP